VNDIQIVQVDERDSGWELSDPRFRVYLHGSGEFSTSGWADTYDITGADVIQVIDWAQREDGTSLTYASRSSTTSGHKSNSILGMVADWCGWPVWTGTTRPSISMKRKLRRDAGPPPRVDHRSARGPDAAGVPDPCSDGTRTCRDH
jgi:hypothetical protein